MFIRGSEKGSKQALHCLSFYPPTLYKESMRLFMVANNQSCPLDSHYSGYERVSQRHTSLLLDCGGPDQVRDSAIDQPTRRWNPNRFHRSGRRWPTQLTGIKRFEGQLASIWVIIWMDTLHCRHHFHCMIDIVSHPWCIIPLPTHHMFVSIDRLRILCSQISEVPSSV